MAYAWVILKDDCTTGQHGHHWTYGDGRAPCRLSRRVDNGMGNDRTEDGIT